jgi:hypothetical protein
MNRPSNPRKDLIKKLAGKYTKKRMLIYDIPEEDEAVSLDEDLICKDDDLDLRKVIDETI